LLFDTSVMIERERAAAHAEMLAGEWAISAVTLAELNLGVLLSKDPVSMQRRLLAFQSIADSRILPFDATTARTHAELVAWARSMGEPPSTADGMIAATAATNGLTLVTIDSDFARLAPFEGLDVIVL
jgi:predicted nucleic acid-binding protein